MGTFVAKLFLLIGAIIWSIMTALYFTDAPLTKFDLTFNSISTIIFWFCLAGCILSPHRLFFFLKVALFATTVSILSPAWYYTYLAFNTPDASVFDISPPISGVVAPLVIGCYLFLKKRAAIVTALGIWLFFNIPIIAYLVVDFDSLYTPRGLDFLLSATMVPLAVMALMLVYQHITQQINALEIEKSLLKQQSELDELTQTYNRRYAYKLMKLLTANKRDVCCIFVDVDHFKQINDNYGHNIGDTVLQELVLRCKGILREQDHFIRWGGEEFLVLAEGVSLANARLVAEKLRQAITETPVENISLTASFGVSQALQGQQIDKAIQYADNALYQAKASGRNQVVVCDANTDNLN
jgi:diguanylate cyclase (GGDEF)-like protein